MVYTLHIYIYIYIHICINYNIDRSALPDMYIRTTSEGMQCPRASVYVSGKAQVPVL